MNKIKDEAIQTLRGIKDSNEIVEMIQIWNNNIAEYENKFFKDTNDIENLNLLIELANAELDRRKVDE